MKRYEIEITEYETVRRLPEAQWKTLENDKDGRSKNGYVQPPEADVTTSRKIMQVVVAADALPLPEIMALLYPMIPGQGQR